MRQWWYLLIWANNDYLGIETRSISWLGKNTWWYVIWEFSITGNWLFCNHGIVSFSLWPISNPALSLKIASSHSGHCLWKNRFFLFLWKPAHKWDIINEKWKLFIHSVFWQGQDVESCWKKLTVASSFCNSNVWWCTLLFIFCCYWFSSYCCVTTLTHKQRESSLK